DETASPMGARLLRRWLARPLRQVERINDRLAAIEQFIIAREARDKLRMVLGEMSDLERLAGRFATARILSPRDFLGLKFALWRLPEIKQVLEEVKDQSSGLLSSLVS